MFAGAGAARIYPTMPYLPIIQLPLVATSAAINTAELEMRLTVAVPLVSGIPDSHRSRYPMGIARTMPLCKFPEMARYVGSGDVNDGSRWVCPSHDASLLEIGLDGDRAGVRRTIVPEIDCKDHDRDHHGNHEADHDRDQRGDND